MSSSSSPDGQIAPDLETKYINIIDGILAISDLETISAKRIRQGVQKAVQHDVTPHKQALTDLILKRFDIAQANIDAKASSSAASPSPDSSDADIKPSPPPSSNPTPKATSTSTSSTTKLVSNGKRSSPSSASIDRPAFKKHKAKPSMEDADAALAAKLQAEENGRARSTRGGVTNKRKAPVKRKKKSKDKVDSDDDSDASGLPKEKKEVERKGGFHKPHNLSAPLASLLGESQLSRPQTVKRIWEYIKANGLQDQSDKRQIHCDDNMRSVFKQDKVHMFTMNKLLNQHMYAVDE